MNPLKTLTGIGLGVAVAMAQAAVAAPAPDSKLWSGTWHLSTAKSKFHSSDTAEKSETRHYTVSGNHVTMKTSVTDGTGKSMEWSYSAGWDGKWYPMVGNPNGDQIALTPVSGRSVKSQTHLHGKLTATATASVSADGQELTIERRILNAKSGSANEMLVFARAK